VPSTPHPCNRAERPEPAQQLAATGAGRLEALHAQQPADPVQRSRHMHIKMSVDAAGDGARVFYDGHRHPFL
jgi:hypothetical protein